MTELSKKLINIIISMMLITSLRNCKSNHLVAADCPSAIKTVTIGRLSDIGVDKNFVKENSTLTNSNCNSTIDKKEVQPFRIDRILDKRLVLQIRGTKIMKLFRWLKELSRNDDNIIGRCFGVAKRLKFILPIVIFKLGIIITILVFLSVFALKSLAIGVLLLILNVGGFIGKIFSLKSHHEKSDEHSSPAAYIPIPINNPYHRSHSAPSPHIHLHVHNKKEHDIKTHHEQHAHASYYDEDVAGSNRSPTMSYSYPNREGAGIAQSLLGRYLAHASEGQVDAYEPYATGSATSPYRYYTREYPPTAWASRVSSGVEGSTSEAEKRELLALYKRLGFDISRYLRQMKAQGLK